METKGGLLNELIFRLETLPDIRRGAGQRHSQSLVLLIVLFATMSGYLGYRSIGDFIKKHKKDLIKFLNPKKGKLPSFSTVRRILINLDSTEFKKIYQDWLLQVKSVKSTDSKEEQTEQTEQTKETNWCPIDGKAVRGANLMSKSDYTHIVSIFSAFDKIVVDSAKVEAKTNEIPCVQEMIQSSDLKGVIFTLDALHCQKKQQKLL
jgi:hypothetical protein